MESVLPECSLSILCGLGKWTKENENNLERTQKTFAKLVLEEKYTTYYEALKTLQLDPLKLRREKLTLGFIKRSLADGKLRDLFPINKKAHMMKTTKPDKFIVQKAHTERLKKSPILAMQRLLNENTWKHVLSDF